MSLCLVTAACFVCGWCALCFFFDALLACICPAFADLLLLQLHRATSVSADFLQVPFNHSHDLAVSSIVKMMERRNKLLYNLWCRDDGVSSMKWSGIEVKILTDTHSAWEAATTGSTLSRRRR